MLKVVLDTNIFISGLAGSPSCRKIINAFNEERFLLVVSPETLDELIGVMARPKFHHLLELESYAGIPILSAVQFLAKLS